MTTLAGKQTQVAERAEQWKTILILELRAAIKYVSGCHMSLQLLVKCSTGAVSLKIVEGATKQFFIYFIFF